MKKMLKILLLFIMFCSLYINVNAEDYTTKQLVDYNSVASVATDTFTYSNVSFVYDQNTNNSRFVFESVVNNTDKARPVSVDILLFNENKQNIGFVTYCSEKDYSSSPYSQMVLNGNTAVGLEIKIVDKYFVEGYSSKDIAFYSIMDENYYCHIGGYDKYKELTIEEIIAGKVNVEKTNAIQELLDIIDNLDYRLLFIYIMILIVNYIVTGIILNELNKKMNACSSPIAYVPIGNNYLSVKLAFGSLIGNIYLICLFISIVLFIFGIRIIYYIFIAISSISFILDIVKILARKYDWFVFEPVTSNYIKDKSLTKNKKFDDDVPVVLNTGNNNKIVDLNYSRPTPENQLPVNPTMDQPDQTVSNDDNLTNDKDDGETDLSNLFR